MATGGVETTSNEGGEHGHENEWHDSEEEAQRLSVKDGEVSEKDPRLIELFDSLSPVMSKIGRMVYDISESATYLESFLGLAAKVQDSDFLETIADALGIVQEMVRNKRTTKEEYLKAMLIIPVNLLIYREQARSKTLANDWPG